MPRLRRSAATFLLAWLFLGAVTAFGPADRSDDAAGPTAAHCDHGTAPAGETPRGPSAPSPCQWPLPLLCCQQVAAADAGVRALAPPPMLWMAMDSPLLPERAPVHALVPAALPLRASPALQRSVVLQV